MKKILLAPVVLFLAVWMCSCNSCKSGSDVNDNDSLAVLDSAVCSEIVDSTLWGHIGSGSGMSVIEFVTDKGDTLYLRKNSGETGEEANILGTIRNNTDRFAVTVGGKVSEDEDLYIVSCINASELMGTWKSTVGKLALYSDGSADNQQTNYTQWQLINGKLVFSGKTTTEYGETDRIDTMQITWLDEDTLKFVTPQHEELSFGK